MINIKFKETTSEFNGYGMPKVKATADKEINIINRGWNCFEATEEVNEIDLLQLLNKIDTNKHDMAYIEIEMPSGKTTSCWYDLKNSESYNKMIKDNRIIW